MPSWTIASIALGRRRARLLVASTSRSVVTCEVRSVRFLCALSMMRAAHAARAGCPWCCAWSAPSTGRPGGSPNQAARSPRAPCSADWPVCVPRH